MPRTRLTRTGDLVRNGGFIKMKPALFKATYDNEIIGDLTDQVVSGTVTLDLDRPTAKMTFDAELINPDVVKPYSDWIAPYITLEYSTGVEVTHQLGLFQVEPAAKTFRFIDTRGKIDGRDACWRLAERAVSSTYNVASGTNVISAVRTLITSNGFTRISIPPKSRSLGKARSWPPGTPVLTIVNELLEAVSYYNLWSDRFGILTSMPYIDLYSVEPAAFYYAGENPVIILKGYETQTDLFETPDYLSWSMRADSEDAGDGFGNPDSWEVVDYQTYRTPTGDLVEYTGRRRGRWEEFTHGYFRRFGEDTAVIEPFETTPIMDTLANQIIVIRDKGKDGILKAVRTNNDPRSPTSVAAIGLKSRVINESNVETQAEVDAAADRYKSEWSNVQVNATLRTLPEPWHNMHEVYHLSLRQRNGKRIEEASGRFWCTGWKFGFTPQDAVMTHTIHRIVEYGRLV